MNPQSQGLVRAITGPIILITVGTLFSLERFVGVGFGKTWPVLLIVIGVLRLVGGRRPRRDAYFTPPSYTPPAYTPPYNAPYTPPAPPPPPGPGERR